MIWGGNPGGLVAGTRHQFWGSNWWKQVSGGAYGGNASFQGYAVNATATTWQSPPASSGHGPASVPDVIGVLVTTQVDNRGVRATGNIARRAILRVQSPASYQPNGGHAAFGVLRAFLP